MASISSGASSTAGASKRLLHHAGTALFWLVTLFAFRRICIEPPSAHYRLFTLAGRALWAGRQTYNSDHGTGIGLWLYSPSCGMFFFGPFSLLPDPVGQFLYMAFSITLFAWGTHALLEAVSPKDKRERVAIREIFYVLCAAPMLSAVVSTKLEIAMTGVLMLSAAALFRGRYLAWAGFAMAVIANWKLQPVPTILLMLVVLYRGRGLARFGGGLVAGLVLAWALPRLFLPWSYLSREETAWGSSLVAFTRSSLYSFENVFTFVKFAFGSETPWWLRQASSALTGLAAAAIVWVRPEILFAAALGAAFTTAFSPLGQSSALILTAPLLLWISLHSVQRLHGIPRTLFLGAVALSLIVPYSDLFPLELRDWMHALSIKPMILLVATGFALYLELCGRSAFSRRGALQ